MHLGEPNQSRGGRFHPDAAVGCGSIKLTLQSYGFTSTPTPQRIAAPIIWAVARPGAPLRAEKFGEENKPFFMCALQYSILVAGVWWTGYPVTRNLLHTNFVSQSHSDI